MPRDLKMSCPLVVTTKLHLKSLISTSVMSLAHSPISSNTRGHMFLVQISLFIVTFLSLISQVFFPINAIHQRRKPTPLHCTTCQYVESFLLLMPHIDLLVHGAAILPRKAKCEVVMWRWIMCYDTIGFPCEDLFYILAHNLKPYNAPSHLCCTSLGNLIHQRGKLFKEVNIYMCVHYSLWMPWLLTNLKCKPY